MIVDAPVAVKWFTVETLHEDARALLTGSEPLLAPDILAVEFANAMWAKARRDEINEADAVRAIAAVSGRGLPQLEPSVPLLARAFEFARLLDHPVYDCVYVALAERRNMPLVTADRQLAQLAEPYTDVRLLGAAHG